MITDAINLLIICIFAFIPLLLGERARNLSAGSAEDFILQSRRLKLFPMYATVFATWMSAFAFMGGITYFFEQGPIYMTTVGWDMLFAVLFILIGRRVWHYGKTNGYMTAADFFDDLFRLPALTAVVTAITILCTMLYLQAQIAGAVLVIRVGTDGVISTEMGGLIFFSILVIYLWAGGLRAVAMTDVFYGIMIVTAMIGAGIFLIVTAGGVSSVFEEIIRNDPRDVSIPIAAGKNRIAMWVALFIIVPTGAFMGPQMWIRNYAAGSAKHFLVLPLLLGLSSIICIGTMFSGSAGIVLTGGTAHSDAVIIDLMREYANPYFYVFVIAGIFAAIFSTANSQVHALAAVYTIDVHRRYLNDKLPDRRILSLAKTAVLLLSVLSWILMILLPQKIFDLSILGMGGLAQLIVPVLGALFWKRSSGKAALAGILAGELAFIGLLAGTDLDASICGLIALGANGAVFLIFSLLMAPNPQTVRRIGSYRKEFLSREY